MASAEQQQPREKAKAEDPRGTAPPLIQVQNPVLPTGGGAIRGIGEKFSANAATGTASVSIPLGGVHARGVAPDLSLSYDSGSGNGPFGSGWTLSVPRVSRKTDQQLPTYLDADDADVFVLSGDEDLVPVSGGAPGVRLYRPRVESAFARIERHFDGNSSWWECVSSANVRSVYGKNPFARVVDPRNPGRIFSWLLERTEDPLGNVVEFDYVAEDLAGVVSGPAELHRLDGRVPVMQRYLSAVRYGNAVSNDGSECAFSVVFDYGDHVGDTAQRTAGVWPVRPDPFSVYRSGFEVRTYRRCRRVMMFHRFPELGPSERLVSSVELSYDDHPALSHLLSVEQRGYGDAGDVLATPALLFEYTEAVVDDTVHTVSLDSLGDLPGGVDSARHQWVDLDAEGIPGVLTDGDGDLLFRRNLGGGALGPAHSIGLVPTLARPASTHQQLLSLDGGGRLDLVDLSGAVPGFHSRIPAGAGLGDWEAFQPFASLPKIDWADPNLRMIDLDGDGVEDVLISRDDVLVWYPSLGKAGFGPPRTIARPGDEETGPAVVFADGRHTIVLADLSGDGLRDLVRIENGSVCYWPNLGHGAFGAKVTMANPPTFDTVDQFEAGRVLFADIDGTGTTDLLYAGRDGVRYWLNLAGNGWSAPHEVRGLPFDHRAASVTAVDLLGTGTACLAWTSAAPSDSSIRYVDLQGGVKPHLLAQMDNQLGLTTRVAYAPSTRFYLADRAAGIHWKTQLPFVVQVVERVEVDDAIRKVRFVSTYRYRDGHYDGYEREYRGFGYVEQRDTESDPSQLGIGLFSERPPPLNGELTQPPVVTKTWFHVGRWLDDGPDRRIAVDPGISAAESRDAYRALRGSVLRQEICAEDGPLAAQPFRVVTHGYGVRRVVPATADVGGVFFVESRETLTWHSERATSDARVGHELVLEFDDYGHALRSVSIGYPRQSADARPEQRVLHALLKEAQVANVVDQPDWYRHGLPLESRAYELAGLPAGIPLSFEAVASVAAAAVAIDYDQAVPAGPSKRLVERSRSQYYDSNAIPAALPFGQIDGRALPFGAFGLAFTPTLLQSLYRGRVTPEMLTRAGYVQLPGDSVNWWVGSGRAVPDPARFFLADTYVDAFGNVTQVQLDPHSLVALSTTDALGNTTASTIDYRRMTPRTTTDANGNTSQVACDALGRVTALWLTGASGEGDPVSSEPTVAFDYSFFDPATGSPSCAHSRARERHADPATPWQHAYAYFDGSGQPVMRKVQAEPGPAKQRLADGTCADVDANPRFIGNGRTVLNNKGNPIKQFEPYFSVTSGYEDEDELVCQGVTPMLHYDALGRLIRSELPDGSVTRVERGSWQQVTYDANDTVLEGANAWYAHATTGDAAGKRAAAITALHAATPTTSLFDSLGRAFCIIADDGEGRLFETRTVRDIEGNELEAVDRLGRTCMRREYNLLGQACHHVSIDAGERWAFYDVGGQVVWRHDGRGQTVETRFDALRRPVEVAVAAAGGAAALVEKTVWGESSGARNARGRVYQHFDGAGLATSEAYDFKGNLVSTTRQLLTHYQASPDWNQSPPLENEIFRVTNAFDALNRPVTTVGPDGSTTQRAYGVGAMLESVDVETPALPKTRFAGGLSYNEKRQRTQVSYGRATATSFVYDPRTFRLAEVKTSRQRDRQLLQDLSYTYDPVGNVVEVRDGVQRPVFYDGDVVDGSGSYEYSPLYRLKTATGREHAGGSSAARDETDLELAPLPHPNDGKALTRYRETYAYDAAGNILSISHGPEAGAPAWVSPMRYLAGTNRLDQTMSSGDRADDAQWSGRYSYDAHGNTLTMPHLRAMDWDWKDQLQHVDRMGGGDVYYAYDSTGKRLRKTYEHGGLVEDTLYVGGCEFYRQRRGTQSVEERQTLHVMDGVSRIAMVETQTVSGGARVAAPEALTRFQLGNHLGSACVEVDEVGVLISYEEYHPFGTSSYRSQGTGRLSAKRYRYGGMERDEETGLNYHNARYYSPWLGRWTAADPIGLAGGLNLYEYVSGNPVTLTDPSGTDEKPKNGQKKVHAEYQQLKAQYEAAMDAFSSKRSVLEGRIAMLSAGPHDLHAEMKYGYDGLKESYAQLLVEMKEQQDQLVENWGRVQAAYSSLREVGTTASSGLFRGEADDRFAQFEQSAEMLKRSPLTSIGVALWMLKMSIENGSSGPLKPDQLNKVHKVIAIAGGIENAATPFALGLALKRSGSSGQGRSPDTSGQSTAAPKEEPFTPPTFEPPPREILLDLPEPPPGKVVATSPGGPITTSGIQAGALPGYDGLPAVGVWESAKQTGVQLRPHGFFDRLPTIGVQGGWAAGHAELQSIYLNPAAEFVVVSKDPCIGCRCTISQVAAFRGTVITVLSPSGFQFFLPDGNIIPEPKKK